MDFRYFTKKFREEALIYITVEYKLYSLPLIQLKLVFPWKEPPKSKWDYQFETEGVIISSYCQLLSCEWKVSGSTLVYDFFWLKLVQNGDMFRYGFQSSCWLHSFPWCTKQLISDVYYVLHVRCIRVPFCAFTFFFCCHGISEDGGGAHLFSHSLKWLLYMMGM